MTLAPLAKSLPAGATSTPPLIISEINWAGSPLSTADEWLEITNVSGVTQDLSAWQLLGATGANPYVFIDATLIEPGESLIIANYAETSEKTALLTTPGIVTPAISLSNSNLHIQLLDTEGNVIDEAGSENQAPLAGNVLLEGFFSSMERISFLPGNYPESWQSSIESIGFKDNTFSLGNPGTFTYSFVEEEPPEVIVEEPAIIIEAPEEIIDESESIDITAEEPEVVPPLPEEIVTEETDTSLSLEETTETNTEETDTPLSDEAADLENTTEESVPPEELTSPENQEPSLSTEEIIIKETDDSSASTEETVPLSPEEVITSPTQEEVIETNTEETPEELVAEAEPIEPEESLPLSAEETTQSPPSLSLTEENTPTTSPETQTANNTPPLVTVSLPLPHPELSEIYPRPATGEKEWIEIFCSDCVVGSLNGWSVADAAGKKTLLNSLTFSPEGFAVLESPLGKLNNDKETVLLLNPSNVTVEQVSYGTEEISEPDSEKSLAKNSSNNWLWTSIVTPNDVNAFDEVAVEPEEASDASDASDAPEQIIDVDQSDTEDTSSFVEVADEQVQIIEQATTSEPVSYLGLLRLSELYAATLEKDATDEYIELENITEQTVSLVDWSIKDASGKSYVIEKGEIEARGYYSIYSAESHISLNNTGDTVKLLAPDGSLIDEISYSTQTKGQTFALIGNTWQKTSAITPKEENLYQAPSVTVKTSAAKSAVAKSITSKSTTNSKALAKNVSLLSVESAMQAKDSVSVEVTGFVLVPPNTMGKTTMYLFDATGGLQVYFSKGEFPELKTGDGIRVTGTMGTSQGERRIKIASAQNMVALDAHQEPSSINLTIAKTQEVALGSFVSTDGLVVKKQGDTLTIEKDGNQLRINQTLLTKKEGVSYPQGANLVATGVVSQTNAGRRLILTDLAYKTDDPAIDAISGTLNTDIANSEPTINNFEKQKSKIGLGISLITLTTVAGFFLRHYIPRLKQWYAKRTHFSLRTAGVR